MQLIEEFQSLLSNRNEAGCDDYYYEKLVLFESGGLLYLDYYGDPAEESFQEYLALLSREEVASKVRSLTFNSPDRGANGTREWDFSPLLDTAVIFTELTSLYIEPGEPDEHNNPIVGRIYEEEGMLGRFLAKSPNLLRLTSPSAPDASFFQAGRKPLYYMRIETGYDHQDFILNLSRSDVFPELRAFDFGDYNQRYMEDYHSECTPFEYYQALFMSPAFSEIRKFTLRNSQLTEEEIAKLKAIRGNLAIKLIESYNRFA